MQFTIYIYIYIIQYIYICIYIIQCIYIHYTVYIYVYTLYSVYIYTLYSIYIYIIYPMYIYVHIYHLSQLLTPGVSIFRHRPRRDYAAHRNFSHRSEGTRRRSRCRISMEKVGSKPIFTLIFWGKTLVNIGNI